MEWLCEAGVLPACRPTLNSLQPAGLVLFLPPWVIHNTPNVFVQGGR